jgi:fructokinase
MEGDATPKVVVGLGELLWDLLPAGLELGGAVSNFALMTGRFGDHAICASRIGNDQLGHDASARMSETLVDCSFLQVDNAHPTGTVSVELSNGQPEYTIHSSVAWDFLAFTDQWRDLACRAEAVCFGTLAQRSPESRETIRNFLRATTPQCVRIFDVNLRPPYFSAPVVRESLSRATIVKMNNAELPRVIDMLEFAGDAIPSGMDDSDMDGLHQGAEILLHRFPIELVCVTLGSSGSLMVDRSGAHYQPGVPVEVVDTVGAGDAFTAAVAHGYLRRASLAEMSKAANWWGAWMASRKGGMPALDAAARRAIGEEAYK